MRRREVVERDRERVGDRRKRRRDRRDRRSSVDRDGIRCERDALVELHRVGMRGRIAAQGLRIAEQLRSGRVTRALHELHLLARLGGGAAGVLDRARRRRQGVRLVVGEPQHLDLEGGGGRRQLRRDPQLGAVVDADAAGRDRDGLVERERVARRAVREASRRRRAGDRRRAVVGETCTDEGDDDVRRQGIRASIGDGARLHGEIVGLGGDDSAQLDSEARRSRGQRGADPDESAVACRDPTGSDGDDLVERELVRHRRRSDRDRHGARSARQRRRVLVCLAAGHEVGGCPGRERVTASVHHHAGDHREDIVRPREKPECVDREGLARRGKRRLHRDGCAGTDDDAARHDRHRFGELDRSGRALGAERNADVGERARDLRSGRVVAGRSFLRRAVPVRLTFSRSVVVARRTASDQGREHDRECGGQGMQGPHR